MNIYTTAEVLQIGLEKVGISQTKQARVKQSTLICRFKRHYGPHPFVCAVMWETLQTHEDLEVRLPDGQNKMKHFNMFLMTMFFLKTYPTEEVLASRFGVCEQSGREWSRYYIHRLAALFPHKVVWPDTWNTNYIASVDCVNFGLNEPRHPTLHKDQTYFDRKGGKAGVSYEIALHIFENKVIWFNGPFAPNDGGDRMIYEKKGLMEKIPAGKKLVADKIYNSCQHISCHNSLDTDEVREFKSRARARQECINASLKSFDVLHNRYRHGLAKHQETARAVLVIVIFQMEHGSPLFNV